MPITVRRDILLIGASAGGVHVLSELVRLFPHDLSAAVFIVIHVSPHGKSAMPEILSRAGHLPAVHPTDGDPIEPGRIYVAPPDYHLVIERGRIRVSRAPTENAHRPAVDVLFRTGAEVYGPRTVGVVLTGNLDDGTAGLAAVKRYGGVAVVQDPAEADYPSMPQSAIDNVNVDYVERLAEIVPLLVELTRTEVEIPEPSAETEKGRNMKDQLERGKDQEQQGAPAGLSCPECGGSLFEPDDPDVVHFRCRTGHAYSPESLLAQQDISLEGTLWAAVRALQENAALARRMEKWMRQRGRFSAGAERYSKRAEEAERHGEQLRLLLVSDMARAK